MLYPILICRRWEEMAYLPADPVMLLSVVNMKLRDAYPSFAALCEDMGAQAGDIQEKLASIGYRYDAEKNAFV